MYPFWSETTFGHTRYSWDWTKLYPSWHSESNKPAVSRRKATHHPTSLTLPLEKYPQWKRIKSNTVAAHLDCIAQDTPKSTTPTGNEHFGKTLVHPILLVRPVTLPLDSEPTAYYQMESTIWHLPSLLQIISHLTPSLVRWLITSWMPYMSPPACQIPRK